MCKLFKHNSNSVYNDALLCVNLYLEKWKQKRKMSPVLYGVSTHVAIISIWKPDVISELSPDNLMKAENSHHQTEQYFAPMDNARRQSTRTIEGWLLLYRNFDMEQHREKKFFLNLYYKFGKLCRKSCFILYMKSSLNPHVVFWDNFSINPKTQKLKTKNQKRISQSVIEIWITSHHSSSHVQDFGVICFSHIQAYYYGYHSFDVARFTQHEIHLHMYQSQILRHVI